MNNFITTNCILKEFTAELLKRSSNFSCGDKDLDEFFHNYAETYRTNLMGKIMKQKLSLLLLSLMIVCE